LRVENGDDPLRQASPENGGSWARTGKRPARQLLDLLGHSHLRSDHGSIGVSDDDSDDRALPKRVGSTRGCGCFSGARLFR